MSIHYMTRHAHLSVAVIAFCAIGTLALQTAVDLANEGKSFLETTWLQARYFTNLTVFIVAVFFSVMTARRRWLSSSLLAATTVWIVIVGIVYHALLAVDHDPQGLDIVVNVFQHSLIPTGVLFVWLFLAPKSGLSYVKPVHWLVWPLGYAAYALVRGAIDGKYAYFFIDPIKTGVPGVVAYVIGLGVLFYLSGALITFIGRKVSPQSRDPDRVNQT